MKTTEQDSAQAAWVARLCPQCGLCCNGVLFADVRVLKQDYTLALENAGLKMKTMRGKTAFAQPCACFDGRLCQTYAHRPSHCRNFICHTLKQSQAGEIHAATALRRIRVARQKAEEVKGLLRSLGNQDEHLPLTRRYQSVMEQPIELSKGDAFVARQGKLMLTVQKLMDCFHRDFLA